MTDGVAAPRAASEAPTAPAPPAPRAAAAGVRTRERPRLGLRARSAVASALGALAVAAVLSISTYALVRSYLLDQRERSARSQAFANARLARNDLVSPNPNPIRLLLGLRLEPGTQSFLYYGDVWFGTSSFALNSLPDALKDSTTQGATGRMRFILDGAPHIGMSVAIPALEAGYLEVVPLAPLERTLSTLRTYLALAAATTSVGGAVLGLWTSRRALRPLNRVARAAQAIAQGGLETRLRRGDPDLDLLAGSFNGMADALQARIQREARFASDVSHELRTPLAALTASAEVLDGRRHELPERSRQALDILLSQLRRFDRMVLDLLEISRADAGAADLHVEPVPIAGFVRRAAAAAGHGTLLRDAPDAVELIALADRRRLERVLANLLANADVHAGGPVAIGTRSALSVEGMEGPAIEIWVDDAGPGIPVEERARVFERFARGQGSRQRQGTGLGLAIVSEHVRAMRGAVRIEERPGGGARFVVALPSDDAGQS